MSAEDRVTVSDIADAWHWCVLAGLTTPAAAACTDGIAVIVALVAIARGYQRPAATLSATAAASAVAIALAH
ncbi:hypothetical protein ACFRDV_22160 [Streptomyces fagopyri]|uniref:hypothetical protein n=1 Tax=Streptomyces fagopyri TaxID=2662397 RepID=UPI0036B55418